VAAQLHKYIAKSSTVAILSFCRPHCADTGLQSVQLETEQKPFDPYRLAVGLGRVTENTKTCQGHTTKLQKCFINVAELLQICCRFVARHRVSVSFEFCQFSVDAALGYSLEGWRRIISSTNHTTVICKLAHSEKCIHMQDVLCSAVERIA
jgi:hypothetical protein